MSRLLKYHHTKITHRIQKSNLIHRIGHKNSKLSDWKFLSGRKKNLGIKKICNPNRIISYISLGRQINTHTNGEAPDIY